MGPCITVVPRLRPWGPIFVHSDEPTAVQLPPHAHLCRGLSGNGRESHARALRNPDVGHAAWGARGCMAPAT
jgi:hypothetical protein